MKDVNDQNQEIPRITFCPMCRTKIEKVSGCNHMTCLFCSYEFCWYCGGDASNGSGHWNGFGCGASMMRDQAPPSSLFLRILLKLGWFLLGLILFPIILVFGVPVFITLGCIIQVCNKSPMYGCFCCILSPLLFAFGLVLDICFIPFAIIFLIYQGCKFVAKRQRALRENKENAERKFKEIIEKNQKILDDDY